MTVIVFASIVTAWVGVAPISQPTTRRTVLPLAQFEFAGDLPLDWQNPGKITSSLDTHLKTALASTVAAVPGARQETELLSMVRSENVRLSTALRDHQMEAASLSQELSSLRQANDKLASAVRFSSAEYNYMPPSHYLALCLAHARAAFQAFAFDLRWSINRQVRRAKDFRGHLLLVALVWQIRAAKVFSGLAKSLKQPRSAA